MASIIRFIRGLFRNFNIENKAHRHLDKMQTGKPQPAPKHKISASAKAQQMFDDAWKKPDESLLQKNEDLASKLKMLEVKTIDPNLEMKSRSSRPLPEKRPPKEELQFGIPTPTSGKGKINLKEVMDILSERESNPTGFNVEEISKQYNLNQIKVQQMLSYYGLFKMIDFRNPNKKEKIDWETKESQEDLIKAVPTPKTNVEDDRDKLTNS